jgi:hypothetical protein
MAGVGASMGAMRSSLQRGRRGKGKRRQGHTAGGDMGRGRGCHGERLLGATRCSWLMYVCSGSYVRRRKQHGEEKKEKRRKRRERRRK